MVDSHPAVDWLHQPDERTGQVSDDDLELAYRLQHSQAGDENSQHLLVERFAAEIQRLVAGWLAFNRGIKVSSAAVRQLVVDILAAASFQVEGFRGEESVRNWIYRLAIKLLTKRFRWKLAPRKVVALDNAKGLEPVWHLTRAQRGLLWLRYAMQLDLPDCAFILDRPLPKIQRQLSMARSRLVPVDYAAELDQRCRDCWQAIWDRSDGLLKADIPTLVQLESHLLDCPQCQAVADLAARFEHSLAAEIESNWPLLALGADEIHAILVALPASGPDRRLPHVAPRWIKAGSTGLIIVAFIAAGIFWMGKARQESDRALIATPEDERLPAVILNLPATQLTFQDQGDMLEVQYLTHDQSDDGNWVVYSTYDIQMGDPDYTFRLLVNLYHTTNQVSQIIFESEQVLPLSIAMWLNSPVISADGDRVVFSGPPGIEGGEACLTSEGLPCLDIYTYQQSSGELTRITQSWEGGPSNGDSYSPAISADGQVITFWSTAKNLVPDPIEGCAWDQQSTPCMQAYVYSVASGELSTLRLAFVQSTAGADRMSLSADGSVIALTTVVIDSSDLSHYYTYLYDRSSTTREDLNHAVDGTPGDGNVYGAVVDASGRYVAFVSNSTNLVPDDTNGFTDVFWYDRQSGELLRVNLGPSGEQADDHSGILTPEVSLNSLDMSADGQKLIYLSLASNLAEHPGDCALASVGLCHSVYYYDRQTGETELVAPRRNNGFYFFPSISGTGRWVAYSGMGYDCQPLNNCSEIYRHDRQLGWTDNLTGFASDVPGYAWLVGDSIGLPSVRTNDMAFSHHGDLIAAANSDGRVRLYQVPGLYEYAILENEASSPVVCLDISPDDRMLAGGTASGEVYIWDILEKRLVYVLDNSSGGVIDVYFSPDSSLLTIVTAEMASIWQFGERVMSRQQNVPLGAPRVQDTDLSPVGNLLATARLDGTVWLQLMPNGAILARLAGGEAAMYEVIFSPDGTRLASRSLDGTVNVWQIAWLGFGALDVTPLSSFHLSNWAGNLAFMADGSSLATSINTGGVGIWDLNDRRTYQMASPQVGSLVFAPQGDTLATASFGSLSLWSGPGLTAGQYFIHAESDALLDGDLVPVSAANDLRLAQWLTAQDRPRSLQQIDELWPADLVAPAHLPAGVVYQGAYLIEPDTVLLHYTVDDGSGPPAVLYILELPVSDGLPAMWVGASALVQHHSMDDILFEFVSGDWLPGISMNSGSAALQWKWDNQSRSSRLRWQAGDLLIAMYYHAANADPTPLVMEDMLQIAAGFQPVTLPPRENVTMIKYLVQPGDTCTWIADHFWVDMEDIIQENDLAGSCDTIFAGQELLIPISHLTYIANQRDFDCNGEVEQVEVVLQGKLFSGVRILVPNDTGFFVPAWEWILDDEASQRFNLVHVINNTRCPALLAVQVLDGVQLYWSVFTWDGQTMQPLDIDPVELELLLRT